MLIRIYIFCIGELDGVEFLFRDCWIVVVNFLINWLDEICLFNVFF